MKINGIINIILLLMSLLSLAACESSHISLIRINTTDLEHAIQITNENASSLSEIQSIISEVCNEHGLEHSSDKSPDEVKFSRYWGSSNHKHPNTIFLSLSKNSDDKDILEISIFEWQTIIQTEFGEKIQAQLLKELKTLVPEQEITLETL